MDRRDRIFFNNAQKTLHLKNPSPGRQDSKALVTGGKCLLCSDWWFCFSARTILFPDWKKETEIIFGHNKIVLRTDFVAINQEKTVTIVF